MFDLLKVNKNKKSAIILNTETFESKEYSISEIRNMLLSGVHISGVCIDVLGYCEIRFRDTVKKVVYKDDRFLITDSTISNSTNINCLTVYARKTGNAIYSFNHTTVSSDIGEHIKLEINRYKDKPSWYSIKLVGCKVYSSVTLYAVNDITLVPIGR